MEFLSQPQTHTDTVGIKVAAGQKPGSTLAIKTRRTKSIWLSSAPSGRSILKAKSGSGSLTFTLITAIMK